MDKEKEKKEIPLEAIKDTLPDYEDKKDLYKLRHYLHYHLVKKKKVKQTMEVSHTPYVVKFD
jgi:hypothetical protein